MVERFRRLRHRKLLTVVIAALLLVGIGLVIAQDQETLRIRTDLATEDPRFPQYLARLLGHPLTQGDSYIVHSEGPDAFAAMLAAIDQAMSRISLETYIFASDETGHRFLDALERAAQRGVKVHVVLDSFGAGKMDSKDIDRLERAGIHVGWYNKVASYAIEEANYRTHRKELVVDGRVAFVGGMGLADQWARDVDDEPRWRDTQVEMHGPVVDNVEAGFSENWIETGGVVDPQVQTDSPPPAGQAQSTVVWSSPQGGANSLKLLYLLAIASARKTIDIQSPYVITDESTQWSLAEARKRGVRIRILMEGDRTDAKPVKYAGRADYESLLRQGIELYEYQPSMMHAKSVGVDGILSIVGSANFDNRSLELNDELNVAAFDRGLAARLLTDFERDRGRSKRIELEEWRSRPLYAKAREKAWNLFGEIF
jgi:cardiolipin synthase